MKRRAHWLLPTLAALVALGWMVFGGNGRRPGPPGADEPALGDLSAPALVARGEYLATIGGCASCHTTQGGARLAGGRELATPFGNIPAPNITPDPDTGIGRWSFEDFRRALQEGRGRHGELLYPAFPYTSYTRVNRADALAIFAWLRSLPPVRQPNAKPALAFPYSVRKSLAAWRALYFKEGEFRSDPAQSPAWNRGAYLVQGLGHCNECHAARDMLGGTPPGAQLTGGRIPEQNWYAPDLSTGRHGGLEGWSEQDIVDLLKTGQSARGTAFGPMAAVVVDSTQHLSDADLRAVAGYLRSLPSRAPPPAAVAPIGGEAVAGQGEKLYVQRCADCHGRDGRGVAGVYPPLDGNSSVTEPTGINAIRAVLLGGFAPATAADPRPYSMPPFAQQLNDAEVAAVVSYIRRGWNNRAGAVRAGDVGKYRHTPID